MSAQESAGAELLIEHSADGTLLHGTSRGDRELIDLVKGQGFRWSRNLGAWFLPRGWSEPTRLGRVKALAAQLGERLQVDVDEATPARSAAEREAERAARRAEIEAGASAAQLFDSWAGSLSPADYRRYVAPASVRALDAVRGLGAPLVHFGTGTSELLPAMLDVGVDVVVVVVASRSVTPIPLSG